MLDTGRMLKLLQKYAEGEGIRYGIVTDEELTVFGCSDELELRKKLDETQLYIKEINKMIIPPSLDVKVEAAMIMLDLYAGDEQPMKDFRSRTHVVLRRVGRLFSLRLVWSQGLRTIANEFEWANSPIELP